MKMESHVRLLKGTLILLGLVLAYFVSPWWLALIGFVGVNLFQSAFTNFCLAEMLFRRLGWGTDGHSNPSSATKR
jgi:Protein of unknown function (DUF2892)